MKSDIHPKSSVITVKCTCGNQIEVDSTLNEDLDIEICSNCHPFYTGNAKIIDTGGRVQRFKDKFGDL